MRLTPGPCQAHFLPQQNDLDVVQACGVSTIIIAATQLSLLEDSMKTNCGKLAEGTECLGELIAQCLG